jgi:formaldehyde-activating enzyme involved in methanogenesis
MAVEVVVAAAVPPDLADLAIEIAPRAVDRPLELALAPRMATNVPRELVERPAEGAKWIGTVEVAVASAVADDLMDGIVIAGPRGRCRRGEQ